jgi:CRISPR-associated protein Cmr3
MIGEKMAFFGCEESYFFRDSTPFDAGENNFLASQFPPGCQVMQGVIRTALLNGHGADFQAYKERKCSVCGCPLNDCAVMRAVGEPGNLDNMELDFYGPFLIRQLNRSDQYERIYPAPGDLVRCNQPVLVENTKNIQPRFGRLCPGEHGRDTDLGRVLLPMLPAGYWSQPMQGAWISETGLLAYLRGELVDCDALYFEKSTDNIQLKNSGFLKREERIGITRNVVTRATEPQMFYAIQHLRFDPKFELNLGVRVRNLPDIHLPEQVKLGGEGRMTSLRVEDSMPLPYKGIADAINHDDKHLFGENRFKLVFLTPVDFDGVWPWQVNNKIKRKDNNGEELDVWQVELAGIKCALVTMYAGRMERIGGWDLAHNRPKPRRPYLPAGSVLYLTSSLQGEELVAAFHDHKLGKNTKVGFGQAVIGRW